MAEESVGPGIVEWYGGGDRPGHRCGYCKSTDSNVSDGNESNEHCLWDL